MKSFQHKAIAAVLLLASFSALIFCGCGILPTRLKYIFTSEPSVTEGADDANARLTAERTGAYNSYGYDSLNDKLRYAYETLDAYISKSYSEPFTVSLDSVNDFEAVMEAYENDHPEVFWLDSSSRFSYTEHYGGLTDYYEGLEIELSYSISGDELENAKRNLEETVSRVVADAPESATDYEMELYINDYIISHCDYVNTGALRHDAYGALVNGEAVCDGYSKAFHLLCSRLGIECVNIEGSAEAFNEEIGEAYDEGHMWNCVKIDGDWYHIDVTWNDGDEYIQRHAYFNMTTEQIEKNHKISPLYCDGNQDDSDFINVFVPHCTADAYNYFKRECVTITDLDDDSQIIAAILQAASGREEHVDFLIDEKLNFDETVQAISNGYGYTWIDAANYYNNGENQISTQSEFCYFQELNVISFYLDYVS